MHSYKHAMQKAVKLQFLTLYFLLNECHNILPILRHICMCVDYILVHQSCAKKWD